MQMKNFKEDFPLLRENPVAYLDSAATAQRPESVNPVKQSESSLMQGRSVK